MIDSQPGVSAVRIPEIIPERVDRSSGWSVRRASVQPWAVRSEVSVSDLRTEQRVIAANARAYIRRRSVGMTLKSPARTTGAPVPASQPHAAIRPRTSAIYSRTSGQAPDCRWADRGRRSGRRSRPPRCSGSGWDRDRREDRVGSRWISPTRARRATPFQLFCPSHIAIAKRRGCSFGKLLLGRLEFLKHDYIGLAFSSQRSSTGRRPLTPFTL
jgi:hypothetical protein